MRSRRVTRTVATGVTVFAVSSGLVAVLVAVAVQQGALGQDGIAVRWLMPAAAVLMVGGVAWLLLGETPRRDMEPPASGPAPTCPHCGREVTEGWRLCPWCGYRSDERQRRVSAGSVGTD